MADPRRQGLMIDHRLPVLVCRTAETTVSTGYHSQNRMWEVPLGFKDGDTMLSINELHI